jgi:hypothetical protein
MVTCGRSHTTRALNHLAKRYRGQCRLAPRSKTRSRAAGRLGGLHGKDDPDQRVFAALEPSPCVVT